MKTIKYGNPSPFILSAVLSHVKDKHLKNMHENAYKWKMSRLKFYTTEINSELKSVKNSLEKITNHLKKIEDNLK
tara:strand:+ start:8 stop:232 length:225 start_codon:yes stop_codon:yes gene_type:complete